MRAIIFGMAAERLGVAERRFFQAVAPAGFILFKRNCQAPAQLRALTDALRDCLGWAAPILIDQEGGRVQRLAPPVWAARPAPGTFRAMADVDPAAAAMTFWWHDLERQVRIEGQVEQTSAEESDAYFHSRPAGSRLGAWASPQSQVIDSREVLEQRLEAVQAQYADAAAPRPPHWGGYRLVPTLIEFWQGRPSRLHDRLCYRLVEGNWVRERLGP